MPNEGEVIRGRYKLVAHLGDGGTASVWKAFDRTLEREVAIKFLYCSDDRKLAELRRQFLREARIACAVKHRNVIQTVDFGTTDDGLAYMVMELLTGEELAERMDSEPRLTLDEVVQIMSLTLRGLAAIHEAGIVHRDLKPENVYLERDHEGIFPKILDFGIAKSTDPDGSRRSVLTTKEGVVVGTPEYMSPEQARGRPDLDVRSDVWSAGVILYELLTGKLPFDDPYSGELIIKIATTEPPPVTELNPDVPEPVAEVVHRALQKDPDARFQSALEMQRALIEAARACLSAGTVTSLSDGPIASGSAAGAGASPVPARGGPPAWLLPVGAAIVAGALVLLFAGGEPTGQPAGGGGSTPVDEQPPESVHVELRGVPEDAQVLVNGKPAGGTSLELPNDGHARLIEVQAPGHKPWKVMHPAGNDGDYEVRLPEDERRPAPSEDGADEPGAEPPGAVEVDERPPSRRPAPSETRTKRRATERPSSKAPPQKKVWRNADF
ncbi:MAG: protein kinase [Myxococcales bacterium]|jgi:serine/threonine-protein kinase